MRVLIDFRFASLRRYILEMFAMLPPWKPLCWYLCHRVLSGKRHKRQKGAQAHQCNRNTKKSSNASRHSISKKVYGVAYCSQEKIMQVLSFSNIAQIRKGSSLRKKVIFFYGPSLVKINMKWSVYDSFAIKYLLPHNRNHQIQFLGFWCKTSPTQVCKHIDAKYAPRSWHYWLLCPISRRVCPWSVC